MKFLTDRKEIAREINIKRTPVIEIEIGKCMEGYEDCYEGDNVRVAAPSANYPDMEEECTVKMYGDEKENQNHDEPWKYGKIVLTGHAICLSSSFGYYDVMNMAKWSKAQLLHAGDKVVVIFKDSVKQTCAIRLMKVSDKVRKFCQTVATLEDVD